MTTNTLLLIWNCCKLKDFIFDFSQTGVDSTVLVCADPKKLYVRQTNKTILPAKSAVNAQKTASGKTYTCI